MGTKDYWNKMLVYFGISEDDERYEEEPRERSRRTTTVSEDTDSWDVDPAPRRRSSSAGPSRRPAPAAATAGVGVVPPRTFNDAQTIADQFKRGVPVIVNLQQTDAELSKRVIDFASGLTYGLSGSMQRIADKVFLLTPEDVEVSAEDRAAMIESGFFNQA